MKPHDLRGAARLATDATIGLTALVEAMHERIARVPGMAARLDGGADGKTTGITGLVYKSIRGVTQVVGGTVDALLGLLAPALQPDEPAAPPPPEREALVAALNGVLGDHLAATANPLAITMALRCEGRALPLQADALRHALTARGQPPAPTLLILLHGLCMNDLQWQRASTDHGPDHDHGALLARALGATAVYLHYNSGLPIAENGRQFAALLQGLIDAWPLPVQRVVLLGHSMGGLVARSALHEAALAGLPWPTLATDLVCLGTPHQGAPLERAGHGLDRLLAAAPFTARYTAPLARLGRVRSAGIQDLRHGLRQHPPGSTGKALPLPDGTRCWALAGALGPAQAVWGDGLVPVDSALGRHRQAALRLAFAPDRQAVVAGCGHLELLSHPAVAQQLLQWLAPAASPCPHDNPG